MHFLAFLKEHVKSSFYHSGMQEEVSTSLASESSAHLLELDRWYSGCFLWSQYAVPVFTVDSEVAYVSAFTNSMMVGISRLEAITANKMKADFISSISRM